MAYKHSVVCKPIDSWPGEYTQYRQRSMFSAHFSTTMHTLNTELGHLDADTVVLELDVGPDDIRRLDGWPRATAKVPPPVKLSFNSKHGPLVYATDIFTHWHDNLRAIALGLEALRKVDRYGVTADGQQYAGWKALGAGTAMGTTRDQAAQEIANILFEYEDVDIMAGQVLHNPSLWVKRAQQATHPDAGGDHEMFVRVQKLAEVLS